MDAFERQVLVAAVEGARDWHQVGSRLRADPLGDRLDVYRAAFDYMYVESDRTDRRAQYGPFAPIYEMDGHIYPIPLQHMPEAALESWTDAAASIDHPLLRS